MVREAFSADEMRVAERHRLQWIARASLSRRLFLH